jgi:hypothetical protein
MYGAKESRQKYLLQVFCKLRKRCLPNYVFSGKVNDSLPTIIEIIHVLQMPRCDTIKWHIGEAEKSASWQREFLYFVCTSLWHFCCLCALVWWTKETVDPKYFTVRWTQGQKSDLLLVFTACDVFKVFQPFNKLACSCPSSAFACQWKFHVLCNYKGS